MTQPRWLELAWADLGVAETPGPNHTARVVGYYADVGHAAGGATTKPPGARPSSAPAWSAPASAAPARWLARSYLAWGEPLDAFRYGAIAVLSRTADPALGHVGFLVGETAADIILLGGNQGDRVSVEAFPRSRLLGLRWPLRLTRHPGSRGHAAAGAEAIRDLPPQATPSSIAPSPTSSKWKAATPTIPTIPAAPPTSASRSPPTPATRRRGHRPTTSAALKAELKAIPPATVRRIYRDRYWLPASCPELPAPLALFHFDAAVNHGLAGAARMLQEAVGADVDGEIGPETLAKAASRPVAQSLARYADVRRRQYRSLSAFCALRQGLARAGRSHPRRRLCHRRPAGSRPFPQATGETPHGECNRRYRPKPPPPNGGATR